MHSWLKSCENLILLLWLSQVTICTSHDSSAALSWDVQTCDLIWSLSFTQSNMYFLQEFNLNYKFKSSLRNRSLHMPGDDGISSPGEVWCTHMNGRSRIYSFHLQGQSCLIAVRTWSVLVLVMICLFGVKLIVQTNALVVKIINRGLRYSW